MIGISMIVLAGMAVLGVDVGRHAYTASEAQVVADAGAVAYAKTMLDNSLNDKDESPLVAADLVVDGNFIDGKSASRAHVDYAVGRWDFDNRKFRPGGFPANGVRATGAATIDNLFAGIFGDYQSTVSRRAIAAYGGAKAVRPTLPIALGDCHFSKFQRSDKCSDLPRLKQVPEGAQNTCWTSLSATSASASEVQTFLPPECCHGGRCGGGVPTPVLSVGDQINVLNGSGSPVLQLIEECIKAGITEFIIPIIDCGKCNQATPIVGFANVTITNSDPKKGDKGLDVEALCKTEDVGGTPGGGNYGLKALALVD